jgi:hypothetical protein
MFCAAIPVASAVGTVLNGKQINTAKLAEASGEERPESKPIMQITAGTVVFLLIGSITYHTLTYLP